MSAKTNFKDGNILNANELNGLGEAINQNELNLTALKVGYLLVLMKLKL